VRADEKTVGPVRRRGLRLLCRLGLAAPLWPGLVSGGERVWVLGPIPQSCPQHWSPLWRYHLERRLRHLGQTVRVHLLPAFPDTHIHPQLLVQRNPLHYGCLWYFSRCCTVIRRSRVPVRPRWVRCRRKHARRLGRLPRVHSGLSPVSAYVSCDMVVYRPAHRLPG
jgi:hypothetical protein